MTLRLDCLGSGHAFSHGAYWSGYLLGGRVLLDAPPQTLAHLYRLGEQTLADLDLVVLSHVHSDHVFGLDLLLLDLEEGRARDLRGGRPLAIAAPPGGYERLRQIVGTSDRLPPREDASRIVWLEDPAPSSFEWAGIEVERVEMEHAPTLTAHGYRAHLEGRTVAYTGDTRDCPAVDALAEGADLLIVECGDGSTPGAPPAIHFTWSDILALRRRLPRTPEVLVTHYDHLDVPLEVRGIEGLTLAEDFATYEV
ncbi:MAG: MBL fold metallo-hydrolase [Dehalococcoidia bacterium]